MHVLFIHQNFPAQFRFIAPRLVSDFGWRCTFVTEKAQGDLPGVEKVLYKPQGGARITNHPCTRNFENAVAHAHGVFEALKHRRDLKPDLIVAHTGFGSSLFVPFVFDAPIINFLEFYYHPIGQDLGYRPEVPVSEMNLLRSRTNNSMILQDLANCNRGWTPTHYQRDFFPPEFREKIEVIFDGIDTSVYFRKEDAGDRIREQMKIPAHHRIVTYVARGFEMIRGFDIFMKAAKRIYEQLNDVTFIVVGTDRVHYGGDLKLISEKSFRQHVLGTGEYDLSRFRFPGFVAPEVLADILSTGDVHIYLTEPFIASWSMVNAMACGAVLVASDQRCVREYVTPGVDGILADFFDFEAIASRTIEVLKDPAAFAPMRLAAMKTVIDKYSLDVALPRIKELFERVAVMRREPSVLLEKLVRAGTMGNVPADEDVFGTSATTEVAGAATSPESAAAPGNSADAPGDQSGAAIRSAGDTIAYATPMERAVAELQRISTGEHTPAEWVRRCQSFRGPPGPLEYLGPRYHPNDITRLLQRVAEWRAQTILEIGFTGAGTVFLWTRVATPKARIILAPSPGNGPPPEIIELFAKMPRPQQQIRVTTPQEDPDALSLTIDSALEGQEVDFLFLHGKRTFKSLQEDFRRYRRKVREGGLIAIDGFNALTKTPETNGTDRLWAELRPLYPQRAEYLNGTATDLGGIVMIKI
jgi:glycosyltransferase involved in cell wall biosynthesis